MDTNTLEPTRGGKTSSHQVHQCICPLTGLVHRHSASACPEVVDGEWSCWSLTLAAVYGHYISPTRTQAHGETPPRVNRSPLSQARTGGVREKSLLRWRLRPLHWHGVSVRANTAVPQRCSWVKKVLSHLWGKRRDVSLPDGDGGPLQCERRRHSTAAPVTLSLGPCRLQSCLVAEGGQKPPLCKQIPRWPTQRYLAWVSR